MTKQKTENIAALADDALVDAARATRPVWQKGIAGQCNLVSYDGDDIVGVAVVPNETNRDVIVASRNREPKLAEWILRILTPINYHDVSVQIENGCVLLENRLLKPAAARALARDLLYAADDVEAGK